MRAFLYIALSIAFTLVALSACDDDFDDILRPPTPEELANVPNNFNCTTTPSGVLCTPK